MSSDAHHPIRPMRPVDYSEGAQSTAGRSFAIGAGLLSSFVSVLAVAAWIHDLGRQVPCGPSEPLLFDIPTVGVALSAVMLLGGMAVLVVSLWRKPHWTAGIIGVGVLLAGFLWIIAAIAFHSGNVSNCFPGGP
jgi:uncharacterized BrkB/YihY/UPF0761 family membrane protein